jgi:hypothetical protein
MVRVLFRSCPPSKVWALEALDVERSVPAVSKSDGRSMQTAGVSFCANAMSLPLTWQSFTKRETGFVSSNRVSRSRPTSSSILRVNDWDGLTVESAQGESWVFTDSMEGLGVMVKMEGCSPTPGMGSSAVGKQSSGANAVVTDVLILLLCRRDSLVSSPPKPTRRRFNDGSDVVVVAGRSS